MLKLFKDIPDSDKWLLDLASITTVVGALMSILPAIAALFTVIWTGIRIYETDTVQRLLGHKPKDHNPE